MAKQLFRKAGTKAILEHRERDLLEDAKAATYAVDNDMLRSFCRTALRLITRVLHPAPEPYDELDC